MTSRSIRRFGARSTAQILVVRLVEHDDDVARHRRDERLQLRRRDPRAGRIVRIGDEHDARLRRDRRAHRGEIVAVVARRHLDAARAARLRGERIDGERMLRVDGLVARLQERQRHELENVVAAVAEHELRRRDAQALRAARPSA